MIKRMLKTSAQHLAATVGRQRWPGGKPRLWVLMYHRVLPASDPRFAEEEPGMVVTPETFRLHLQIAAECFELMPLSAWLQRREAGQTLPAKACAITFDDGWRDNYEFALPVLRETQTPATLFAVAEMIGTNRQFWPNRIATLLTRHRRALLERPDADWLADALRRHAEQSEREQLAAVIAACKAMGDEAIEHRLDRLEQALPSFAAPAPALADWQQLREMASTGLVEIGSHTSNHRRLLPTLDAATLSHEIVASKSTLENNLDAPVELFCYPNGDVSPGALQLVREHYRLAVTTRRGINHAATPAHELQRIGMHEDATRTRTSTLARLSGLL